jgi:hypothetical protein
MHSADSTHRTSGLLSIIGLSRLQAIVAYSLPVSPAATLSRHTSFVELLTTTLSKNDLERWWLASPFSKEYQRLLVCLYEGINHWSCAAWVTSPESSKARIVERFYVPLLHHMVRQFVVLSSARYSTLLTSMDNAGRQETTLVRQPCSYRPSGRHRSASILRTRQPTTAISHHSLLR